MGGGQFFDRLSARLEGWFRGRSGACHLNGVKYSFKNGAGPGIL
jgi:hypothetical protein